MSEVTTQETTSDNSQQGDSTLIFVKSSSYGVDSKGRDKLDLRFSEEETATLKEELSKINSKAKLQIHINQEGKYGPSVFLFVKEVGEMPANKNSRVKSSGVASSATASKIAALKGKK